VIEKTHLDLFSGIGGFAIAAQNCGYKTIGFCEKEPYAQQILKERFGAVLADSTSTGLPKRHGAGALTAGERHAKLECRSSIFPTLHPDIFTLNGADYAGVDLLTGGFPCQPFSVAGKRRGAADDRAIFPELHRVIEESKPAWFLLENVAGIIAMELDNYISDLEGIGYEVGPCLVLPAASVGAPHRRDRVWIIGRRIVAHSNNSRPQEHGLREPSVSVRPGEDVAHADEPGSQGRNGAELRERGGERAAGQGGSFCAWPAESDWFPQSPICRVAHGIPNRAHRLRGLGNAIVPQVAEEIIRNLQY